jgi:Predicted integral membrane protein
MSEEMSVEESNSGSFLVRGFLKHPLIWVTAIGLLIRVILGFFLTFSFDFSHWALVIENVRSGNGLYNLDGYYYTPVWGYLLSFVSSIGDLIGVGDLGARVVDALLIAENSDRHVTATLTTLSFNMLVKTPLFLCDIAVAYVIRWLILWRTKDKKKANWAYVLWFLCPLVIVVSSVNGMFDNFSVLMILLSMVFLIKNKYFLAGTMFGMAVLTKFFPAFFIFIFIAYIMAKHKGDGTAIKNLGYAALGAVLITFVILLPNILGGTVMEAFSFLTSRADSGMGLGLGAIESYGTILAYAAFLVISMYIAVCMYKEKEIRGPLDYRFMFFMLLNTAVLFLYPSTPQYILLLLPFLIYAFLTADIRFKRPLIMLSVGATVFSLSTSFMLLLSAGAFSGMFTVEQLSPLIDLTLQPIVFGINFMNLMYIGGVVQYIATIYVFILIRKMSKEGNPENPFESFVSDTLSEDDLAERDNPPV